MTPEERNTADAINAAITESVRQRKQSTIPSASSDSPEKTSMALRHGLLFALMLTVNIAGILAYQLYHENQMDRRIAEMKESNAQAIREKQTAEANARAEADKWVAVLKKTASEPIRPVTPEIEYNVVKDPRPQPKPAVTQQPEEQRAPKTRDRSAEHAAIALDYLIQKKRVGARATSTEQVPGWDGRYRTEFEITRNPYQGTNSLSPRHYEVLTQEKDGKITAIDINTKGY